MHCSLKTKEIWNSKDKLDFINNSTKSFSEYSRLVSCISSNYAIKVEQADLNLKKFLDIFINLSTDNEVTDSQLVKCITTFIGDLEGHPIKRDFKVFIRGLWTDREHEISRGLIIRPFKPIDFEIDIPLYRLDSEKHDRWSSLILELNYKSKRVQQAEDEIEFILTCFRLFRLGSVEGSCLEVKPQSFLEHQYMRSSDREDYPNYRYHLLEEDIPKLIDLITRLNASPQKEVIINSKKNMSPQAIALERFCDSLLYPGKLESRITSAINSLEAIYLKKDERAELSHRLGQRASILLSFFGYNSTIKTYNDIHRAYMIRSNYIHGSVNDNESRDQSINDLTKRIIDYARISILIFLQLMPTIEKDTLINKIDNSLLDNKARDKLRDLITTNCIIYI